MLFKFKIALRESALTSSLRILIILDLHCAEKFALFFLFLFLDGALPKSTDRMSASLGFCFWLPKPREPFLKRFHLQESMLPF